MHRIHELLVILIGLVFVASNSLAAENDLSDLIEFYDAVEPSECVSPTFEAKPWREEEKETILEYLQAIQEGLPGLMRRAIAYRPIRVYRTERFRNPVSVARAEVDGHRLAITDSLFLPGNPVLDLIHELVHLADPFRKAALSKEWSALVKPRMDRVRDSLKSKGVPAVRAATEPENTGTVRFQIARKHGFPTYYASTCPSEALAEFTAHLTFSFDADYSTPEAIKAFVKSKLLSTTFAPDPPSRHVHQGLAALENGRIDEALFAFGRAIELDPHFAMAYEYRGIAWENKDEFDRALADFNQVIALTKDLGYARGYYRRGLLWTEKREFDKAIADLSEVIRISLTDVERGLYARGLAHTANKARAAAIADFSEIIRINPSDWKAYDHRAGIWAAEKDYARAIADLSEIIKLRPKHIQAHIDRASARKAIGDMDGSIADCTEAIRIDPGNVETYLQRAELYETKKAYAKAEADYGKAIDIEPENADLYRKRASARKSLKDFKGAVLDYNAVIRLQPKSAAHYLARGEIYMTDGQFTKALADFRQAKQILPPAYAVFAEGWIQRAEEALAKEKE